MKVFTHDDMDGRCAGAVLYNLMGRENLEQDDFIELNYSKPIPVDVIAKEEEIFFLDYSFGDSTVEQLRYIYDNITKDITWIDHHATSKDTLKNHKWLSQSRINIYVQEGICGAGLTYLYMKNLTYITPLTFSSNNKIPEFLKLVDDYDCWKQDMVPQSSYFKLAIDTYPNGSIDVIWKYLLDDSITLDSMIGKGSTIKSYIDATNTEYRDKYGYESEIDGHKCFVVNISSNSWIFGELIKKYDVVAIWCFNGERYNYSIYSNTGTNCKDIATKFGGGGHPGASGFSTDELIFKKIV